MSNRTVLDTTEPYAHERSSSEDIYPISFQVCFHESTFISFDLNATTTADHPA